MRLGFFTGANPGDAEKLLSALAEALEAVGQPMVGLIAELPEDGACTRVVRLLPSGERINIWQNLGQGASSCRLNPEALETAVEKARALVEDAHPNTLVLINKFGKHETEEGGGTRGLIAAALAADLTVLVPVPESARAAFEEFADGMAEEIHADPAALMRFAEALRAPVDGAA